MVEIVKANTQGARWHVIHPTHGVFFSGQTKKQCIEFCRRRGYPIA